MKKELDEKLVAKYPLIFADRNGDMTKTLMCWGFECGDGWYWLIDNLCSCIQGYIDNNGHLNIPQVVAVQVKEKFGTLRFYYGGGDEYIGGKVSFAEWLSGSICENCGSVEGKINTEGYWVSCLCDACRADSKKTIEA